jgi:hypothetical protein
MIVNNFLSALEMAFVSKRSPKQQMHNLTRKGDEEEVASISSCFLLVWNFFVISLSWQHVYNTN